MHRAFSRRPRWWLAVVQVLLLLATIVGPAAAAADSALLSGLDLIQMLRTYDIVKGDEQGNLNLGRPISRAEMITIMVRAVGGENDAALFKGYSAFEDAKGHWADGYIAYATVKGLIKGDGNNRVRPDASVTYAEALTMILRLVKREPTTGQWPFNVTQVAAELGLLPEGVTAANIRDVAVRGLAFQSMGKAITTVRLDTGKTFLQALDTKPPVLTVNPGVKETSDERVTVSGTALEASSVLVNGMPVTVSNNTFSTNVTLQYGSNSIKVVARDLAGNEATAELSISRKHPVATLEITGPSRVRPGGEATYTVSAKDSAGIAVPLTGVQARVEGSVGAFDLTTGVLKASGTSGKGRIVLTAGPVTRSIEVEVMGADPSVTGIRIQSVNDGKAVSFNRPMTVVVETVKEDGSVVDTDYGRVITLAAAGIDGVTISPTSATTSAGLATFTVRATSPGSFTLTASSTGLSANTAVAAFGTNLRVRLSSDPSSLVVGGVTTVSRIRAELRDENGAVVANNTSGPIVITLSRTGADGSLIDNVATISRGQTNSTASGDDALFSVGLGGGSAIISGTVTSGEQITVDPTTIGISVPTVGSGTRLAVFAPSATAAPGGQTEFIVRLEDANGNLIASNSYAFQVAVETSNGETKTNGIPAGVSIQLGTSGLNPVSDGIAEGASNDTSDVIARTAGGIAVIKVTYDKPGKVTLTPIAVSSSSNAYSSDAVAAVANSSLGFNVVSGTGLYQTTPTAISLTANSALGNNQTIAAAGNSAANTVTLNVTLTDGQGRWVPGYVANVTLARTSGTSTTPPSNLTVSTADGKASFVIRGTTTVGTDTYQVSANIGGAINSNSLDIVVQNAAPPQPTIAAVRGVKNGVPGRLDYVEPDDTHLELELLSAGTNQWVQVQVYQEGVSSPIFTSGALNLSTSAPKVIVPKANLGSGSRRYYVIARNGFGSSATSSLSSTVTNALFTSGINITAARYDSTNKRLTILGNGFASTDTIDTAKLTISDSSTGRSVNLSGATVTVNSYSQMTLALQGLADVVADLENPARFSGGDINLAAQSGWSLRSDGTTATADLTGNPVTPGARLEYAVYDKSNSRLYLYGEGLNTGTLDFSKVKLQAAGSTDYVTSSLGAYRASDKQLVVPLTSAVITALDNNGAYVVNADLGWFGDSGSTRPAVTNVPVYAQISLSSVTYATTTGTITVTGSGFSGATVTVANLSIKDLSTSQVLSLANATPTVSSSTITIVLDAAAKTTFENLANFSGDDIYLEGTVGWLVKNARNSAAIPDRALRFPNR